MSEKTTGKETVMAFVENAPKFVMILINKLTSNSYVKITEEDISFLESDKRNIVCKSEKDGIHLFLAEPNEVDKIMKDPAAYYTEM